MSLTFAVLYQEFWNSAVKAVDSANTINSQIWFNQAYADGVRLYIIHSTKWDTCTPWQNTQAQLAMALKAGIKIAAYTRDPTCWRNGILATGPYRKLLQFFAIDIETDPGKPVLPEMIAGIRAMGVRPVIYSGSAMWRNVMAHNIIGFSDIPLWDTNATRSNPAIWGGNVRSPTPVQYGGWNTRSTMRIGVQQAFEYTLHGVDVDLNAFNSSFLR